MNFSKPSGAFMIGIFNNFMRSRYSHVLLYHASFSHVPEEIKGDLHNVTPEVIRQQLTWLKKKFIPVTVDDLADNPRPGCFAVTFDDAYKCVFEEALPVFKELNISFTVYVNSATLEKKIFWRDKVRQVITGGQVKEFMSFAHKKNYLRSIRAENFYRESKIPPVNSRLIDELLTEFLVDRDTQESGWCIDSPEQLIDNPLITYGNHTRNHYVLSSLSEAEQSDEILSCERLLKEQNLRLSRYLSIPFGGDRDFNEVTVRIARRAGFSGFLYSRNRLVKEPSQAYDFPALERFMVPSSLNDFQKHLFHMTLNDFRGRWN